MRNRIATVLVGAAMALSLTACSSQATFEQTPGNAKVELKELDGSVDSEFELPYTNIGFTTELESGSVDIEIVDLQEIGSDDDVDYVELDTIYEAEGVASGDSHSFIDDDGLFLVRITSGDKATGTITFSEG